MKKTITINGRELPLEWRGGTAIFYKRVFKEDPIQKMMSFVDKGNIDLESLDLEFLFNALWASAKVADSSIPDDVIEFLDSFDELPLGDIVEPITTLMTSSIQSTVEPKNQQAPRKKK